ncbi:hypothetical protein PTTG_29601, partial [Puccinia triticina 1-1 BBBD Race 1]
HHGRLVGQCGILLDVSTAECDECHWISPAHWEACPDGGHPPWDCNPHRHPGDDGSDHSLHGHFSREASPEQDVYSFHSGSAPGSPSSSETSAQSVVTSQSFTDSQASSDLD